MGDKMELKILICDDDKIFAEKLKNDLHHFLNNLTETIKLEIKTTGFNLFEKINYDVVFMDIDLASVRMNGISIAKFIKEKNPNCLIIFVSARDDLVFETFKLDTFQFIRKKHYEMDFENSIKQLTDYLSKNKNFALIYINGRKRKVYLNDVKYIISIGNEVTIYCIDTEFTFRSTLKKALSILNSQDLIQIQKNFAVNLNYVDDFVKWKVICGKSEYKIGRVYQKDFLNRYENYLLNWYGRI